MIDLLDPTNVITRMFNAGKYEEMYNYCKNLLEKAPDDMVALQNISLSLIYLKKYEEAIEYCDRVLQIKNSDTYALKIKIYALENLGQYEQVLELCKQTKSGGKMPPLLLENVVLEIILRQPTSFFLAVELIHFQLLYHLKHPLLNSRSSDDFAKPLLQTIQTTDVHREVSICIRDEIDIRQNTDEILWAVRSSPQTFYSVKFR